MALWEDFEKQDGSLQRFSNNPFDYELNDHIEQVSKLSKAPEEMKEPSMLEKRTFNYNSHLGTQITHMVASGDILTIVENGTEIKRFNLRRQILMDRVELHEGIHAIFQDPSGAHLVFSTQISQETHYHHTGMKKAHLVAKSKVHTSQEAGVLNICGCSIACSSACRSACRSACNSDCSCACKSVLLILLS
jgi:hypothetical protein